MTLDGSDSGGAWGTNVTYSWALTTPTSGVTVTFDDDTSAMPVVTIPALPVATELTFTLTVTGHGGTKNISTAAVRPHADDTAKVTATATAPGVTVSKTALTVTEEDTAGDSYAVVLDIQPTADVVVTVAGHAGTDVTPTPGTLTFTMANWNTARTVTVTAGNDADTANETVMLTHRATSMDSGYSGITIAGVTVTVNDNDNTGGICGRTPAVRDALLDLIENNAGAAVACADVTDAQLNAITGTLLLDNKGIPALAVGDFDGLTALTELHLTSNLLTELPGGVFEPLASLQILRLNSNMLTELPAGVFAELAALEVLYLEYNELTELPGGVFDSLTSLTRLVLYSNALKTLPAEVFAELTALKSLWLNNNKLTELPDRVFDRLTSLEGLTLYRGEGSGDIEASVTALTPWAGYAVTERLSVWGAAGYGAGELSLTPEGQAALKTDLGMTLAAAGARGTLIDGDGPKLDAVTDARWVRTTTARVSSSAGNLESASADVTRLRLGLEGLWPLALGDGAFGKGATVTPRLALGVRHDGGDAETGFGADIGGGVALAAPAHGLTLSLEGRGVLTHEAAGLRDRGVAGTLAWNPPPAGRGPQLTLTQSIGAGASGGKDALLSRTTLEGLAANDDGGGRRHLEARFGYGIGIFEGRFTMTPEIGLGLSQAGRDYSLGWRLTRAGSGAGSLELSLQARRRESANDAPRPSTGSGWR